MPKIAFSFLLTTNLKFCIRHRTILYVHPWKANTILKRKTHRNLEHCSNPKNISKIAFSFIKSVSYELPTSTFASDIGRYFTFTPGKHKLFFKGKHIQILKIVQIPKYKQNKPKIAFSFIKFVSYWLPTSNFASDIRRYFTSTPGKHQFLFKGKHIQILKKFQIPQNKQNMPKIAFSFLLTTNLKFCIRHRTILYVHPWKANTILKRKTHRNLEHCSNPKNISKIAFSFIKSVSYELPTSTFASDIGRYFTFTPGKHKLFLKGKHIQILKIVQIPKYKQNKPKIAFSFIKFVSYWLPTSNFASDIRRYFTSTPGKHQFLFKGKHIQILKNFQIPQNKQNKPKIAFSFLLTTNLKFCIRHRTILYVHPWKANTILKRKTHRNLEHCSNPKNISKIAFSFIKSVSYELPTSNFASDIGRYFTFTPGKHKLFLKGKHIQMLKIVQIPKYKQNKPKIAFSFIKFVSYWLPTSNFASDIRRYFTSTPGKHQFLFKGKHIQILKKFQIPQNKQNMPKIAFSFLLTTNLKFCIRHRTILYVHPWKANTILKRKTHRNLEHCSNPKNISKIAFSFIKSVSYELPTSTFASDIGRYFTFTPGKHKLFFKGKHIQILKIVQIPKYKQNKPKIAFSFIKFVSYWLPTSNFASDIRRYFTSTPGKHQFLFKGKHIQILKKFQIPQNKQNMPKIAFSFLLTTNLKFCIRHRTILYVHPWKANTILKRKTHRNLEHCSNPKNISKIAFSFIKSVSYELPTSTFASDIGRYFTFTPGKHKLFLKGKHIQILKIVQIPKYKQNKPKIPFSFIKFVSYWLPTSNYASDIRRYFTSTPGKHQFLFKGKHIQILNNFQIPQNKQNKPKIAFSFLLTTNLKFCIRHRTILYVHPWKANTILKRKTHRNLEHCSNPKI